MTSKPEDVSETDLLKVDRDDEVGSVSCLDSTVPSCRSSTATPYVSRTSKSALFVMHVPCQYVNIVRIGFTRAAFLSIRNKFSGEIFSFCRHLTGSVDVT